MLELKKIQITEEPVTLSKSSITPPIKKALRAWNPPLRELPAKRTHVTILLSTSRNAYLYRPIE